MRYLTVGLDKHAVAYNEKRKRGDFNKKAEVKKEEGVLS
jgi:small subunit ribosomal protein S6